MFPEQTGPGEKANFSADESKLKKASPIAADTAKKSAGSGGKNINPVFFVIIAVLAVITLFLFIAKNNLAAKNTQLRQQVDVLNIEKLSIEKQLNEMAEVKNELQGSLDRMKQEAEALAAQVEQEKRMKENALTQLNTKMQEIDSLEKTVETERQDKSALKKIFEKENKNLKSQLNELKTTKESLEKRLKEMLSKKGIKLEKIIVKPQTASGMAAEKQVEGQILVVNREFDFVVVNLGESDNLKVGSKLRVFKDDTALGVVEVEKLYGNMAAATIMTDAVKDQIKEGCTVKLI